MNSDQVVIVLCRPEESGNIGSVCRAMLTMDIERLRIVGERAAYDETRIRTMALRAARVWENAEFYRDLGEALTDCAFIAGTTRRKGKKRKRWALTPEDLGERVKKTKSGNLAVVFGNERTGLTDGELKRCNCAVRIPSSPKFPSLNLSHAVQLVAYQLYRSFCGIDSGYTPVDSARAALAVKSVTENLRAIGFFSRGSEDQAADFWSDLIARAALSEGETRYLENIFNKINGLTKKALEPK